LTCSVNAKRFRRFLGGEHGSMTIFGIFLILAMFAVGGFAADYANAVRVRTYLQIAADSAAHAALIKREFGTVKEARAAGLEMARGTLPVGSHGNAMEAADIKFGYWDADTDKFTIDDSSRDAVLIDTARIAARGNSVSTFFLKLVGFNQWDLRRQSVYETYKPSCLVEGFVSDTHVGIGSDGLYEAPFCVLSNNTISFKGSTTFEANTGVTAPDPTKVTQSGYNPGVDDALIYRDPKNLRILERLNDIYAGVQVQGSEYYPDYLQPGAARIDLDIKDEVTSLNWVEGSIHEATCTGGKTLSIGLDTLSKGVLITNCPVKFSGGILSDVVMVSTNTTDKSFSGSSGVILGAADNCAPRGGAQLITFGGANFPAKLQMNNGQIIAAGDVKFTSHGGGHNGASIVAGGTIDAGNHAIMRGCTTGGEANFEAAYFRLAY